MWISSGCRGIFVCGRQQVPCGFQYQQSGQRYGCACGNGTGDMAVRPRRMEIMHIPKTAGTWLRKALNEELGADIQQFGRGGTGPKAGGGDENCLADTSRSHFRISLFRRPRHHVLSQYLECRYGWFHHSKPHERLGDFPHNGSLLDGFTSWLGAFSADPHHNGFGCYSPLNMQARAMTCCRAARCANHDTHLVTGEPVPDAAAAISGLRQLDIVGLAEYSDLTMCLITHRLGRVPKPTCFCSRTASAAVAPLRKENERSSHVSVETMSHLFPMIDAMTSVDQRLYEAASARFLGDVRQMEDELGRGPMLCQTHQSWAPA